MPLPTFWFFDCVPAGFCTAGAADPGAATGALLLSLVAFPASLFGHVWPDMRTPERKLVDCNIRRKPGICVADAGDPDATNGKVLLSVVAPWTALFSCLFMTGSL
jgi:hypothetical protein